VFIFSWSSVGPESGAASKAYRVPSPASTSRRDERRCSTTDLPYRPSDLRGFRRDNPETASSLHAEPVRSTVEAVCLRPGTVRTGPLPVTD